MLVVLLAGAAWLRVFRSRNHSPMLYPRPMRLNDGPGRVQHDRPNPFQKITLKRRGPMNDPNDEDFKAQVRETQQPDADGKLSTAQQIARKLGVSVAQVRTCPAFYDHGWVA